MILSKLKSKLSRRQRGARRQKRKLKKTGKRGHRKQLRLHRRAAKKLQEMIAKVKRQKPASGTGSWGGSKSIAINEVLPVAKRWKIPDTSRKRWATYGNPGSDHYRGNKNAFAIDFATASNYAFGAAIGKALGVPYGGASDDYRNFTIERAGRRFNVQIICGTHGTGPHTHVGIRLL